YAFAGNFDGQGHTVSGLYLTDTSCSGNNPLGLFGRTYGGTVKNLSLADSYIQSASEATGAIVGRIENGGSFTNLYSSATVKASRAFVGGLFGQTVSGSIRFARCWFDGKVISTSSGNGRGFVGGLIGYDSGAPIVLDNCLNTGSIDVSAMSVTSPNMYGTAGLVAVKAANVIMVDCAVLGTITKGSSAGYCATYLGSSDAGTFLGIDNYRVNTGWDGNYSGSTVYFGMNDVAAANAKGDAAKTSMPTFDWNETWQTVDGAYPRLNVLTGKDESFKDISWYDAGATSYTLSDKQDLFGLAKLVNRAGIDFAGKTITLNSDVTFNEGSAADWAAEAPACNWTPIGVNGGASFKGTFDGGMHTISGLYAAGTNRMGLFGLTEGSTIKNLKLTNSYISATGQWMGSFVAQGNGTLTNLYSNAILTTSAAMAGGIVGANDSTLNINLNMSNCWFAGSVTNTHSAGANSGAFTGGLVGYLGAGTNTVDNCLVTGTIDISGFVHSGGGNPKTGGLIGVNSTTGSTTVTNTAYLGTIVPGANANKGGLYAIAGDTKQGNMNGSNIYAVVDNHYIAGGYGGVSSGYSISYGNLGESYPTGAAAQTRMPNLDWENTWQTVDGQLPMLKVFAD
ncbi:MAG: hypothetical protein IJU18_06300, partial [Oscillospiraceae bacterium]|nr:hypothetical protein [Oscillospiraceae bacterium]